MLRYTPRFGGAAAMLIFGLAGAARLACADTITFWNEVANDATATALPAERSAFAIDLALMHTAIYDAVSAIDGSHEVFAVTPATLAAGASLDAAAAEAAYRVLIALFPSRQAQLDAARATSLGAIPDGDAKTRGIDVGAEVAAGTLALRVGDGRYAVVPYAFLPPAPGVYQPTPPALGLPAAPWQAQLRPVSFTDPAQFLPAGPPRLSSRRWTDDYNETKRLGSASSTDRTPEESEIARFHTEAPPRFWGRNIRAISQASGLTLVENSRFYALVWTAMGDSLTACWNAKYHFNAWRPVTAIPAGDTDGNPGTEADSSWVPFATTPPHPEYPAAHGCGAGAFAEAVRRYFGTRHVSFTMTSTVPGSVPHEFDNVDSFVQEVVNARIYGGMHFRTSGEHGAKMGRQIARHVAQNFFRPIETCED